MSLVWLCDKILELFFRTVLLGVYRRDFAVAGLIPPQFIPSGQRLGKGGLGLGQLVEEEKAPANHRNIERHIQEDTPQSCRIKSPFPHLLDGFLS